MAKMTIEIDIDLYDGIAAGDAIDSILIPLKILRDKCYSEGEPDHLKGASGCIVNEHSEDAELLGEWSVTV